MAIARPSSALALLLLYIATSGKMASSHEHEANNNIAPGKATSGDPLDAILWIHIFLQILAFGIILPIGLVLGIAKSRWHVPTQVFGSGLAVVGFTIGHFHGGRQFVGGNIHVIFSHVLMLLLVAQVVLGLYLKGHWERGLSGRVRRFIRPCHSTLGKAMPILSWAQMVFGVITALGFCQGDHLGQCLAHFIMGSAFIAYAVLLTIVLLVGQLWMRRSGRSQEFFDSAVIAAWGCFNTFTEHRWGTAWVKNDWQHTSMGIIWWCAGLAGMWLSRDRDGNPKRNFIPGFVILLTGWAMSSHPQTLHISEMAHSMFGKTLIGAGATRIIEIAFVLHDKQSLSKSGRTWNSFQFIPVFLLYAAGFLFMSATEEQMAMVDKSDLDHVSFILILFSVAFIFFLFTNMLVHLYDRLSSSGLNTKDYANGHGRLNGSLTEEVQVGDAEEFELNGLMSDDDEVDDINPDGRRAPARKSVEAANAD